MPATTEAAPAAATSDRFILSTVAGLAAAFVLFGLLVDGPRAALQGLVTIQLVRDTLVTDYIGVGGKGAAFLNAGLLTLLACGFYWRCEAKMTGGAVAALLLVLGFALFGKNLLNVWPISTRPFSAARWRPSSPRSCSRPRCRLS